MAKFEVRLPAMGEGIIEATITRWFADEGSKIEEETPLVEVATDKVDSEIPSPFSGILSKIVYREGEIPKVGEVIAVISNDEIPENDELVKETVSIELSAEIKEEKPDFDKVEPEIKIPERRNERETQKYFSPFVINIARQRGISIEELSNITGTGVEGRITKKDILAYILSGRKRTGSKNGDPHFITTEETKEIIPESLHINEIADIVEMDRIRKIIADNMLRSKRTAPHVTSFAEADVTGMVMWREKIKKDFFELEKINLTYTALITEVVAKALKEFPRINSSVDGDKILLKKEINIGIATALKSGNLVVPVIKNTDKESIRGLAHKINDLATNARNNKLNPAEIKGGTFTITNIGQYKSLTGTPIINQPEVAILAIGTILKKPAVVKISGENTIGIRDIVMLSLTYDHRIIDGALGGDFLNRIVFYLENFDVNRSW